jgi:hypothetical protein
MTSTGTHSAAEKGDKHVWVIAAIAASAAVVVTATWTGIGNVAGFPPIPPGHLRIPTGLTLATGTEGYTGYALWAWLGGAYGERSRRFAGITAICALALSLSVQAPYHLMLAENWKHAPVLLVIGSSSVPVVDVILGSVLGHLQLSDKAAAKEAAEAQAQAQRQAEIERAEADERTALRAELEAAREAHETELCGLREDLEAERCARTEAEQEAALRPALEAARDAARTELEAVQAALETEAAARAEAERQAADAEAKAATLARKLAASAGPKKTRRSGPAAGSDKTRSAAETEVPNDFDAQAAALAILADEPDISGAKLAERVGMSERWGQTFKKQLAASRPAGGEETGEDPS